MRQLLSFHAPMNIWSFIREACGGKPSVYDIMKDHSGDISFHLIWGSSAEDLKRRIQVHLKLRGAF